MKKLMAVQICEVATPKPPKNPWKLIAVLLVLGMAITSQVIQAKPLREAKKLRPLHPELYNPIDEDAVAEDKSPGIAPIRYVMEKGRRKEQAPLGYRCRVQLVFPPCWLGGSLNVPGQPWSWAMSNWPTTIPSGSRMELDLVESCYCGSTQATSGLMTWCGQCWQEQQDPVDMQWYETYGTRKDIAMQAGAWENSFGCPYYGVQVLSPPYYPAFCDTLGQ